jgi:hypothetical protein
MISKADVRYREHRPRTTLHAAMKDQQPIGGK